MTLGAYSLMLAIASANGAFLAAMLLTRGGRHRGSPWLAMLTAAIALRLVPYILGFAGAYDLYPWLTFAPFDLTLAWGPLLWVYVTVLSTGARPRRWSIHLVPFGAQLAYQLVAFCLPVSIKGRWYGGVHLDLIEPAGTVLVLVSLAAYGFAAWRRYEVWQGWLDANVSNREESRLGWLRLVLAGFGTTGVIGLLLAIVHWTVTPLDYFARLPVIAALAILAYVIALLGYRFGAFAIAISIPATSGTQYDDEAPGDSDAGTAETGEETLGDDQAGIDQQLSQAAAARGARQAGKDYAREAAAWRASVIRAGWHRDPALTLARLAELVRTSTRSVSRTLREGRGESFNDFINGIRVEEAAARLAQPDAPDVLRVAFDVGFASKASFNRAFRRHVGATPTEIQADSRTRTAQVPPM